MTGPSEVQLAALKSLFGAVPDALLLTLDRVLGDSGPNMIKVRDMINQERADRTLRDVVFGPVTPLFQIRESGPSFPARLASAVWSTLKSREPALIATATAAQRFLRPDDPSPPVMDELCAIVAGLLRNGGDASPMRAGDDSMAQDLAAYFELAPLARKALPRIPDWLGRVSEERTATLRIALKDASASMPDGAPRLLEMFQAHLPEPQLLLRIISVATDRASDRYLGSSELARFGDRLLDDVDTRIERVRTFDPNDKSVNGRALGADVSLVCQILSEFERSVELSREGAWGARVTNARRKLATTVESRLRDMEGAMLKALPMQKAKISGRMTRLQPNLDRDPEPTAVAYAQGLFLLLAATRAAAQVGGYGALHASVSEKLRERLTDYADDVIHHLNSGGPVDEARPRRMLELAAEFLENADDPRGAQLIRRRTAAAGAQPQAQDVA